MIGSGGKVINKIIADTGANININEDGTVFISTANLEAAEKAKMIINGIVSDPEVGTEYDGTVTRLMDFGAFVEFLPGKGVLYTFQRWRGTESRRLKMFSMKAIRFMSSSSRLIHRKT